MLTAQPQRPLHRLLIMQFALLVLLISLPSHCLIADTFSDRRAVVGLKLFRSLMSADLDISNKTNSQGQLDVYFLYSQSPQTVESLFSLGGNTFTDIRNIPVNIQSMALQDLTLIKHKPASIFIAEPLSEDELEQLIQLGIQQHIIVFSPFEGDVEQGVLAGLSVEATVKPFINLNTLQKSQLAIKPFYLKVAKSYE